MAENKNKTCSDSSVCSTVSSSQMGNNCIYMMFNRLSNFATSWKNSSIPRGRRIFHRDVEKEEFQYASSHCLSSYYSVFVVRLAIMVMLAILIGLLTILTWHFTKIYTAKSLNSLAYGLRYELLQRPILRMWNILNSTAEITTAQVKLSEYVIRRYSNPATQADQVEQLYESMRAVTWALFVSRKALNSITINYKNGFVQAFHRDLKDNNTFYIYSDLSNYSMVASTSNVVSSLSTHQAWDDKAIHGNFSAIWYREPLDPITGEKTGKAKKIAPEDLINIAGLSQVPDGVATWHVAVSKFTDSPLLSAALPVWDSSNKSIMAVVGVTTAFYSVGQLMRELVEKHSGHMYLTSQEGYLLATSTSGPLLTNSTKSPPKLRMAVDCEDDVIRLGAEWLQRTYGNHFPSTYEVHVENAKLGDQQYYIDSFFLNLKKLPLVGVIIIPRKYIMGQVDERAFKTLVILISAALCILVIGCVCILILTNGVSKEMNLRAELISQLEARRRAEASSNYKSQFLANMSHELRTPMAAVIGLLDILISDDCLTNEQYSTVTQIRKCSTALLRLLNNILDLSKVESGKLVLEVAEFDLGRELEGLVDMFSVQCINHNVETVLDLSDDMPKVVRGDSARVVQVFANLINNSIKFTTSGHVILRGWCEYPNSCSDSLNFHLDQKKSRNVQKSREKPNANHTKGTSMRDNKVILWFEVEDTGCGIDPSKWDSVFESFEQADPSTTRLHGGTGLGLCIVRNLMGGDIKVVKKEGQGTLMRLCLLLSAPMDVTEQHCALDLTENGLVVLLALHGNTSRILITSKWLQKKGVCTMEASEWNGLTQTLRELFHARSSIHNNNFDTHYPTNEGLKSKLLSIKDMRNPVFVIVVDIGLLDLSTDIWKEQLNFLHRYFGRARFVWMLSHDTSNTIKSELRRKGYVLMVNKPLYKAKMIHILEAVKKERNLELQKKNMTASRTNMKEGDLHEFLEIDSTHFDASSSDDSDITEMSGSNHVNASGDNCLVRLTNEHEYLEENNLRQRAWQESKKMWRVAGPAIFNRFSTFGITVVAQSFIGHIGSTELAAYALVQTVLVRFANGVLLGMASALETLCGQAYGAKQYDMLGVYLQRSWIVLFLTSTLLLPVYIFTTPILEALGQDKKIAEVAGSISIWSIGIVYSFAVSFSCQVFLQAQSKNKIIAYLAAFSISIHAFLSWLLTVKYKFGLNGAMTSVLLAYWIPNLGQLVFIMTKCPDTWKGFSFSAFKDLWSVIKLSLASGAMLCLEVWSYTILILLTGNMENAEVSLDALTICLNMNGWEMMISLGFFAAASVRVSNELGRGSPKAAQFSVVMTVLTSFLIGLVLFFVFLLLKGRLAYIFTPNPEVAKAVGDLSPLLSISILLNSVQPVLSGVSVGAGWQSVVAYVNIGCYYLIGIPVGVLLGNILHLQVKGVWIGMLLGTFMQTVMLITITMKTDWDKQVEIARNRVSKWAVVENDELNNTSSISS